MILNGIGNSSECIITKLLNFIIPKCQFGTEPHLYLYSLKISSLIVVRNSTRILYPGIVQKSSLALTFWLCSHLSGALNSRYRLLANNCLSVSPLLNTLGS